MASVIRLSVCSRFRSDTITFCPATIQSAITCAVASAISSAPFYRENTFVAHWISAYMVLWMAMSPLALAAAPWIRRVVGLLTAPTPTGRASPDK
ncbi:DUF2798 domain-containing protein [Caballeronia cordobensis]|uniref:DUF2798 domain-containing protein n=1 Tax=Caballeronia cordobensis TaxID=1353886 RepID=UPI001E313F0A